MIEAHDVPVPVEDPYFDSDDYRSGMAIAQGEGMLELLRSLNVNIERLSNYDPRQFSKEAPTLLDLGPLSGLNGAGTAAGAVYQTTQRFRVTNIILGGGVTLDNFRLKVGQRPFNFFGTGALTSLPFEIEIDRGIDINVSDVTTPANVAWTFMLFGYAE